jgi:hypothetical protein
VIAALETLEQLLPQAEAVRKGAQFKAAAEVARKAVDDARALPDRLDRVVAALATVAEFPSCPREELTRALRDGVLDAAARVRAADGPDTLRAIAPELRRMATELETVEKGILRSWQAEVEREFAPLKGLGEVLASMPETASAGRQLETWANRALALRGNAVPSAKDLKARATAVAELPERLAALEQLGIDAEVRNFLERAAAQKATLACVTEGVLAWLAKSGAAHRFSVRLG